MLRRKRRKHNISHFDQNSALIGFHIQTYEVLFAPPDNLRRSQALHLKSRRKVIQMPNSSNMKKIVNPNLALAALNKACPYGEFKAFVKVEKSRPHPAYLKEAKTCAPGVVKARIACDQIETAIANSNVISIELREHIA